MDNALRAELVQMWADDQRLAVALFKATKHDPALRSVFLFELPESARPAGYEACRAIAHRNITRLVEIVGERGWPGRSLVGADGAAAAWGIAQHADADNEARRNLLPLLEGAVRAGEAPADHLAALTDRIALADGAPQRYGTLIRELNDAWVLREPIEEPALINARRRAIGLGTWEEWIGGMPRPSVLYGPGNAVATETQ